eukprot:TRINITY_DN111016_c0_g1_i1.p5 TRINITY_DN111016_c0_g1~~TRINITY_DN111016_c0_g1_i1.p5  ORF type:complete len:130 (+),score=6.81 TRINITY_DN111016_c0_g1_i1:215-604(+)
MYVFDGSFYSFYASTLLNEGDRQGWNVFRDVQQGGLRGPILSVQDNDRPVSCIQYGNQCQEPYSCKDRCGIDSYGQYILVVQNYQDCYEGIVSQENTIQDQETEKGQDPLRWIRSLRDFSIEKLEKWVD